MKSMSLHEMTGEYQQAMVTLADLDLDSQVVADTLEGLRGDLEIKAQNVAKVVQNLEVVAEAIKVQEVKMAQRRKALETRAARIRAYLLANMQQCGITKIDSEWFSLSIRKNPPAVVIDNADAIPADFMRQPEPPPPSPDKKAIGDALKAGQEVPGARLEQSERLVIG